MAAQAAAAARPARHRSDAHPGVGLRAPKVWQRHANRHRSDRSTVADEEAKRPANTMWGGRFSSSPSALMEAINASIGFDKRLAAQDIAGSIAHGAMLAPPGHHLPESDRDAIHAGSSASAAARSRPAPSPSRTALEDIHMNVESRLREIVGEPAGAPAHRPQPQRPGRHSTSASGCATRIDRTDEQLTACMRRSSTKAEAHAATVMPGFTHLQSAQPVTFGHHLLAYVEMFGRDRGRFRDSRKRLNECPLGAARARRHLLPDRPAHDREGARLRPADRATPSIPSPTATACSNSSRPPRSAPCTCRASPRRS